MARPEQNVFHQSTGREHGESVTIVPNKHLFEQVKITKWRLFLGMPFEPDSVHFFCQFLLPCALFGVRGDADRSLLYKILAHSVGMPHPLTYKTRGRDGQTLLLNRSALSAGHHQGFAASVDDGLGVELSPTTSLGEEFAGASLTAYFSAAFGAGEARSPHVS